MSTENWACCVSTRAHWVAAVSLAVKPVGKPDAGNPHVRFDERGGETEHISARHRALPRLYSSARRMMRRTRRRSASGDAALDAFRADQGCRSAIGADAAPGAGVADPSAHHAGQRPARSYGRVGVIAPQGLRNVEQLIAAISDARTVLPELSDPSCNSSSAS